MVIGILPAMSYKEKNKPAVDVSTGCEFWKHLEVQKLQVVGSSDLKLTGWKSPVRVADKSVMSVSKS